MKESLRYNIVKCSVVLLVIEEESNRNLDLADINNSSRLILSSTFHWTCLKVLVFITKSKGINYPKETVTETKMYYMYDRDLKPGVLVPNTNSLLLLCILSHTNFGSVTILINFTLGWWCVAYSLYVAPTTFDIENCLI